MITNGFLNITGKGYQLTGVLIEGEVYNGGTLVTDNGIEIPIIDVEFDKITIPETTLIRIIVPRNIEVVWHNLYGKTCKLVNH